jgi:hypothetical protein
MSSDEAPELSGSAELTEATATTGASCEGNGVKFNNKNYEDWGEALVALIARHAACKGTHCHLFRGKGKDSALGSVSDHTGCSRW